MISLMVVFIIFVIFFAVMGGLRGWAKELLVIFSVVLSLFMIFALEKFANPYVIPFPDVPPYLEDAVSDQAMPAPFLQLPEQSQSIFESQFWLRFILVIILTFFGYQTPGLARLAGAARREKIQDFLLGLVFGGVNGYLIIGTIWAYMHAAHYPFEPYIIAPTIQDPLYETVQGLIKVLPPLWLGQSPWIYGAVGISFLFVLVVFI
ncbi:MAG: CvpA family protein [Anaerolineales bacterium]